MRLPPGCARAARRPAVLLLVLTTIAGAASGCARPYRGPKTVASVGVGILAGSAALWVAGERLDRRALTQAGAAGAAAGALAGMAAGTWLAASVNCRVDPDCPDEEACREIPAPPGREPYRQCLPK